MKEALFYEKGPGNQVRCKLCFHQCVLNEGQTGFCLARKNEGGVLVAETYGKLVAAHMDPIEKKPLYHFHPGEDVLSVAANGCNLACPFCQNREISREISKSEYITPEQLIGVTKRYKSAGIAYTYTEPLVWYEYVLESAKLAHQNGLYNVIVSNGIIEEQPLRQLLPFLDAANIDLKGDAAFYRKVLKGERKSTLRTIRMLFEANVHVEITMLLIPGQNDSEEQAGEVISFIANLDPLIPLHLSRYFPHGNYPAPATPPQTMLRVYREARKRLPYVYVGNILMEVGRNTSCPSCGSIIVERLGYRTGKKNISNNRCQKCGREVDLVL